MADECKAISTAHKKWIIAFLKTKEDNKCAPPGAVMREGARFSKDAARTRDR